MFKIALAGGGTLGSVSPLLAIQEAVPEAEYIFIGTRLGIENQLVRNAGIPYYSIPAVKLRRYTSIRNVVDFFKFPFSVGSAIKILNTTKPTAVLVAGSFVAVPVSIAARILGIPVILHHQDIQVGFANKVIKYLATTITVTFPQQQKDFPQEKTVVTGNPLRSGIRYSENKEQSEILILGGSQGAASMNAALNKILPELCRHYRVTHVLGKKNVHQRLDIQHNYTPLDFIERDMADYLSRAALVITRGGLSTLTELAACKRAAILIPMENSHQEKNAAFFKSHDAVVVAHQNDSAALLSSINALMGNADRRTELGSNLQALFPLHAAENYRKFIISRFNVPEERVAHCVGIGGIGISALAQYLAQRGYRITGSDLSGNDVTKRLSQQGIKIAPEHNAANITDMTNLVIYSTAVPANNVELEEARKRYIPTFSYKEYLGLLSNRFRTIAISGTHGKTTTTALTGYILQEAGQDPTVIVGAFIPQFNHQNFRNGKSDILVVEADEYRSDMLHLNPAAALITNIDLDHTDFYRDIAETQKAFQQFTRKLRPNGVLIKNADDPYTATLTGPQTISVGINESADYTARIDRVEAGHQYFSIFLASAPLVSTSIQLPGSFNVLNALAAFAYAHHSGIAPVTIGRAIASFQGVWRRFEKVGFINKGTPVYSDYAHHPTAIIKTIEGIRSFYPKHKLAVAYQPHSYARTYALQNDFAIAFKGADVVILTEIYDVAGRDSDKKITGYELFKKIVHPNKHFAADHAAVVEKLRELADKQTIIIVMGAGDIDTVARTIVS